MGKRKNDMLNKMLDQLSELYAQRDLSILDKQRLIDAILTDEIKGKIAEVEMEFSGKSESVSEKIAELETQIKQAVVANGASVKGQFIHAVYAKGRVTWDSKQLDGLMIVIPELAQARKEGEPSVSLRKI
jgi:hypothetical protein